jgi:hypothetical protein
MTEPLQTIEPQRLVLEQGKSFSKSFVWKLQRAFFEQQGNQARSEGIVPHDITSKPIAVFANYFFDSIPQDSFVSSCFRVLVVNFGTSAYGTCHAGTP